MAIPEEEINSLIQRGLLHTVVEEGNMTCVVFAGYTLPSGVTVAQADLLVRLSPGFPDIPPDMWWFSPAVMRADGQAISATDVTEVHLGRSWQRWSRHLPAGQWQPGVDCIESFLALIRRELERSAPEMVA